jgi:hypothetical protein
MHDFVGRCIGFEVNEGNERLLGRSRMPANSKVDRGLAAIFEAHNDAQSNGLPFIGYVNAINFTAARMAEAWSRSTKKDTVLPPELHVRINHSTASLSTAALLLNAEEDPEAHALLKAHVQQLADDCRDSWSPEE